MPNRGANCTLCFPRIHQLNLKVCLGRLNTDSFAQENSRLAEPIARRVAPGGTTHAKHPCCCGNDFRGCRLQLGLSKGFPQTSERLNVPSRRNVICSSGSDLYFWKATIPRREAGVPQEAAVRGTPGCGSCCGRNSVPGSAFNAGVWHREAPFSQEKQVSWRFFT